MGVFAGELITRQGEYEINEWVNEWINEWVDERNPASFLFSISGIYLKRHLWHDSSESPCRAQSLSAARIDRHTALLSATPQNLYYSDFKFIFQLSFSVISFN